MDTKVVKISNIQKDAEKLKEAADLINAGEIVAFPTETVYGLGANALNAEAVAKIFAAKGRPADNPLIVHIADLEQLSQIVREVSPLAKRLMDVFWPGPLSILLPKHSSIPGITTANLDTVVVRFPSNPIARAFITAAGTPIAAPSANLSGKLSPTKASHVQEDLGGKIPLIIDGGDIQFGLESTVVDCTAEPPVVLRPGSVTFEVLRLVAPDIEVASESEPARAPGMKYKHYSPNIPVILFTGEPAKTSAAMHQYLAEHKKGSCSVLWHSDDFSKYPHNYRLSVNPDEAAAQLFHTLRLADKDEVEHILVQCYGQSGVGTAIMNRLEKAASETIRVS